MVSGCGGGHHPAAATQPAERTFSFNVAHPLLPRGTRALRATLSRVLSQAGPVTGASVYDLTNRLSVVGIRDGVMRAPASVEKLYTSLALIRMLGLQSRLSTTVLGAGHLGTRGVWHGNLYLRGGGDPTFGDPVFNRIWEHGYGPSPGDLAAQLRSRGIRRVSGAVIADESLFDPRRGVPSTGFAPDIADLGGQLGALTYNHGESGANGPGPFAAEALVRALQGINVAARAAPNSAVAPAAAIPLASVSSPPLAVLLKLMDVPSDNFFAEMLTKQLGKRFGGDGSTAVGAGVIRQVLASYGLHPTVVDGSGLSREDRSSPRQVVALLRALWRTPDGSALWDALPVVGQGGPVMMVAPGTPVPGRCVAKGGSLSGITNLAGYCHSQRHRVVAFALFIDGPDNYQGLQLIGRMVTAIARY